MSEKSETGEVPKDELHAVTLARDACTLSIGHGKSLVRRKIANRGAITASHLEEIAGNRRKFRGSCRNFRQTTEPQVTYATTKTDHHGFFSGLWP